jgi:hypothetical protein
MRGIERASRDEPDWLSPGSWVLEAVPEAASRQGSDVLYWEAETHSLQGRDLLCNDSTHQERA